MLKSIVNNKKHPNPFNPFSVIFLYLLQGGEGEASCYQLSGLMHLFRSSRLSFPSWAAPSSHIHNHWRLPVGHDQCEPFDLGDSLEQRPREVGGRTISTSSNLQPPTSTLTKLSPMPYASRPVNTSYTTKAIPFSTICSARYPRCSSQPRPNV
jgi:hypothetical protein